MAPQSLTMPMQTVTHLSTNLAQCRTSLLMCATMLPPRQTAAGLNASLKFLNVFLLLMH